MIAASKGIGEIMQILLSRAAIVRDKDTSSNYAIHPASEKGHLGCVKLLMDKGSLANMGNLIYKTPLMNAAANGHADIVEYLLPMDVNMAYQVNKSSQSELPVASQAVCSFK